MTPIQGTFILKLFILIGLLGHARTDTVVTLRPANNFLEIEATPSEDHLIFITDISSDVSVSIVQANVYLGNVTLSYNRTLTRGHHTTGSNIGLVVFNDDPGNNSTSVVYLRNLNTQPVYVLLGLQVYDSNAPIPGGCNMEQSIRLAPFLPTTYNPWMLNVDYPLASWPLDVAPPTCDGARLQYDIYHLHLPEKDTSRQTLFENLRLMSNWKSIEAHGKKLVYTGQPTCRILLANYIGTGTIVAVIVRGLTSCAAYVPTATFGCTPNSDSSPCSLFEGWLAKLIAACLLFLGIFLTFFGHRFFKSQAFLVGFCLQSFLSVIIIFLLISPETIINIPLSVISLGVVGGLAVLGIWACFGAPIVPVFVGCLILGILFSSIVMYTPLVDMEFLRDNLTFWFSTASLILIVPLALISFPVIASIVVSSCVGSYLIIFPMDQYMGSNLKFIVVNFLRRATEPTFSSAIIDPPFQWPDLMFAILWVLLTIAGIVFQIHREMGHTRAPFPPPPTRPSWLSIEKLRSLTLRGGAENAAATENTPLLA